ncbi:enoyl-CoA hydratase [Deinococcus sp. HMF7620]|uniref:Enoyl-CoA hydratase n=1 Tax=Deinococcus arboris TaxID=2682977 RepID=A0A7C9LJG4_9DEIO|nr:enoyl-CoA hydratase-related protein [Deinococcus arboris]MVN85878.1 enoyl-CoA hydratase [Deinococcus arboris]
MTDESVQLTRRGEVATLTITSKKGSLGPAFWRAVPGVLADLNGARALVVRGQDLFSVGLDVKATAPVIGPALGNPAAFHLVVAEMHAAIEAFAALPIPVVAAVHGWCIGAGLELIAACDLRLCSADARFSLPEVRLGITADLGGLQRLPHLVGRGRAAHLALTGLPIDAATAERWGLVTEVMPTLDALFARAEELAAYLATLPSKALEGTKRTLQDGLSHTESLHAAVAWNAQHMTAEGLLSALKRDGSSEPRPTP